MPKTDKETSQVIQAYSQALLGIAESEGLLDQVEGELSDLRDAFFGNSELLSFLNDPKVTTEGKSKAILELVGRTDSRITRSHLALAIEQGRAALLPDIIDHYFSLAAGSRKKITAKVTTAVALSEATTQKIESMLFDIVGEPVFLKLSVDPEILGGITIHLGDRIIDGSLKSKLDQLREGISRKILTAKGEVS